MSKSFRLIVLASSTFGLAAGCYDFLLPLYMESRGISYGSMGLVFSVAGAAMVLGRIFVGRHSDKVGRKPYYIASLGLMSFSCATVPLAVKALHAALSKITAELSKEFRLTVQSVAVFDHTREKFIRFIGRANAPVFILEGVGVIIAGFLLPRTGYGPIFGFLAVLLFLATIVFWRNYKDSIQPHQRAKQQDSLFSHRMPKELWLIALSGFFLVSGMSASHCFVMPLFFKDKFGISPDKVALILAVHRIAFGLPMLTSGMHWGVSRRTTWIICSTIQSLMTFLAGLAPGVLLAAALWWGHDLFGCGIWDPIKQHYVQKFSREGARGHDLGRVSAFSAAGWIIGPLLAGWTYPISPSLPFIVSGLVSSLAIVPLFFLPKE